MASLRDNLNRFGWMKLPYRFPEPSLAELEKLGQNCGVGERLADIQAIADRLPIEFKALISQYGFSQDPLRGIWFYKDSTKNWSLPWHQDRSFPMGEKSEDPDLTNWTKKNDQWHCEPSLAQLKRHAFVHLAFDPMNATSGQLELLEKSHLKGKIPQDDIKNIVLNHRKIVQNLERGEALLVSALTLHRSSSNKSRQPRRALRLDFLQP